MKGAVLDLFFELHTAVNIKLIFNQSIVMVTDCFQSLPKAKKVNICSSGQPQDFRQLQIISVVRIKFN